MLLPLRLAAVVSLTVVLIVISCVFSVPTLHSYLPFSLLLCETSPQSLMIQKLAAFYYFS